MLKNKKERSFCNTRRLVRAHKTGMHWVTFQMLCSNWEVPGSHKLSKRRRIKNFNSTIGKTFDEGFQSWMRLKIEKTILLNIKNDFQILALSSQS